jgi:hypothetical protein
MYVIYYGTFTSNQQNIINTYMQHLGGSPWLSIITSYSTTAKPIDGKIVFQTDATNTTYMGTALTDTDVQDIVTTAIANGTLSTGPDPNGIYYVLTASGVNQGTSTRTGRTTTVSGFCTQYCGWHSYFTYKTGSGKTAQSTVVKYAWIGDPSTCPSACAPTPNETVSPNNDVGVDAMLSVISHETAETITDPTLSTWYDGSGNECADKCAWNFNTTLTKKMSSNAAQYNMVLNGNYYMIQQDWVNAGKGYCGMHM